MAAEAEATLAAKRLELLKEAIPRLARLAILATPEASSHRQSE